MNYSSVWARYTASPREYAPLATNKLFPAYKQTHDHDFW